MGRNRPRAALTSLAAAMAVALTPALTAASTGSPDDAAQRSAAPACLALPATIVGTAGDDTLVGTPGPDVIVGLDGADVIRGLGGRDIVCGGLGGDRIHGGRGADHLLGGAGDDRLLGAGGNDVVRAAAGHDQVLVSGHSVVHSGDGGDAVRLGVGCDCTLYGGPGDDRFRIASPEVRAYGGDGDDRYDVRAAVGAHELLAGGSGRNHLTLRVLRRHDGDATYPRLYADLRQGVLEADGVQARATGFTVFRIHDDAPPVGQQRVVARYELYGTPGADSLTAKVTGADGPPAFLHGRGGPDELWGGTGDDRLAGGRGHDLGQGRLGADTCVSVEEGWPQGTPPCEVTRP